jgi:limonene-1,2-epoxide hydrolase
MGPRTREPADVVRGLFDAITRMDPDELCSYFTPDAVFVNGASFTLRGQAELRDFFEELRGRVQSNEFEVLHLAVTGDVVLTERIDRVVVDGREIVLPIMGTLEVRDGRVAAWRDYFDRGLSGFQRHAAPEPAAEPAP